MRPATVTRCAGSPAASASRSSRTSTRGSGAPAWWDRTPMTSRSRRSRASGRWPTRRAGRGGPDASAPVEVPVRPPALLVAGAVAVVAPAVVVAIVAAIVAGIGAALADDASRGNQRADEAEQYGRAEAATDP